MNNIDEEYLDEEEFENENENERTNNITISNINNVNEEKGPCLKVNDDKKE